MSNTPEAQAKEYADTLKDDQLEVEIDDVNWDQITEWERRSWLAGYQAGLAAGTQQCIAKVEFLKRWIRKCQVEAEESGQDPYRCSVQHGIFWDVEKELVKLLPAAPKEEK
jgi:hypothetical protein